MWLEGLNSIIFLLKTYLQDCNSELTVSTECYIGGIFPRSKLTWSPLKTTRRTKSILNKEQLQLNSHGFANKSFEIVATQCLLSITAEVKNIFVNFESNDHDIFEKVNCHILSFNPSLEGGSFNICFLLFFRFSMYIAA